MYDYYISRKLIEINLMKNGISIDNIKAMTNEEVADYNTLLNVIGEAEQDMMNKGKR